MSIRKAHLKMINAFPGGWDAMAAALGMTRMALENRVYERSGQTVPTHVSMQMQAFTGTQCFVEALAVESGGTFVKLPDISEVDNDELLSRFNRLYAHVGGLSAKFNAAIEDGEVDKKEKRELEEIGNEIHKSAQTLLALIMQIYCR